MIFKKLALKNKEADPESWEQLRARKIVREIRKKYSLNAELAILRQRDIKPEEFAAYNEYVEACKIAVTEEMS